MEPKYKIGDRVKGINGVNATIVGYYTGKAYNRFSFELPRKVSPYDAKDPEWKEKFVYMVEFDSIVNPYTYEEYKEASGGRYDEDLIEKWYKEVPKVWFMTVPEFNIEKID